MDDFETFRASREKIDPSTRKMSDRQWEQAYAAYQKSRVRVSASTASEESERPSSRKRRSSSKAERGSKRGTHAPSNLSELSLLRQTIREQSAYADLRLIIDMLAWVAVGIVVVISIISTLLYTSMSAALLAVLWGCVQVILVVVARLLVQVLVDIPDVSLYRSRQESAYHREALAEATRQD